MHLNSTQKLKKKKQRCSRSNSSLTLFDSIWLRLLRITNHEKRFPTCLSKAFTMLHDIWDFVCVICCLWNCWGMKWMIHFLSSHWSIQRLLDSFFSSCFNANFFIFRSAKFYRIFLFFSCSNLSHHWIFLWRTLASKCTRIAVWFLGTARFFWYDIRWLSHCHISVSPHVLRWAADWNWLRCTHWTSTTFWSRAIELETVSLDAFTVCDKNTRS